MFPPPTETRCVIALSDAVGAVVASVVAAVVSPCSIEAIAVCVNNKAGVDDIDDAMRIIIATIAIEPT